MQATNTDQAPLRWLRAKDVCDKIAASRTKLYELTNSDPDFPRPLKDGDSRQAQNFWLEHEIEAWMRLRMERAKRG